jgi:hypothetical protein
METLAPGHIAPEEPTRASASTFPYAIHCGNAILGELAAAALEGLCRLRRGGLEIGGVLYGRREPGRITIEAARDLDCEHALGPAFRLSDADWDRLAAMLSGPASDPELEGLEAVGWYVSHTRCGLELTEHDLEIFSRCFRDPAHFALVLNPSRLQPARAGYFARAVDGTVLLNAPITEFCIEQKRDDPDLAESSEDEAPLASEPSESAAEIEVPTIGRRRGISRLAVGLVLAMAFAIGAAGAWVYMSRAAAAGQPQTAVEIQPPVQVTPSADPAPTLQKATAQSERPAEDSHAVAASSPGGSTPATPVPSEHDTQQDRVKQLERELAMLRARLNQPEHRPYSAGQAAPAANAAPRAEISIAPPPVDRVDPGVVSNLAARLSIQPEVAAPPALPPPANPAPAPAHSTTAVLPRAGRVIWTGLLHKGSVLFIEDKRCSSGVFTGALPGVPVRVHASSGELTDSGMIVYASDSKQSRPSESPGAQNGWNYTVYAYDPRRAGDLHVLEAPAAQNGWKRVVIRSEARSASIIVIDWESMSAR